MKPQTVQSPSSREDLWFASDMKSNWGQALLNYPLQRIDMAPSRPRREPWDGSLTTVFPDTRSQGLLKFPVTMKGAREGLCEDEGTHNGRTQKKEGAGWPS